MKSVLAFAIVAILCVVVLSYKKKGDIIGDFKNCLKACKAQNNTFRFCVKFCVPSKQQKKRVFKPKINKEDPAYKAIFGTKKDDEEQTDSEQGLQVPDSKDLWMKYRTVLNQFFRQGDSNALPGLQLVPQPFPADWDIQPEILNFLCNKIPKWAPTYETSKNDFTTEYGDWLMNLKVPATKPIDPNTFKNIDASLRSAEDAINTAEMNCMDRFDSRYGSRRPEFGNPPTYESYLSRYCPTIDRANKYYDMLLADYEIQQRDAYGEHFGLKRAIAKYSQASRITNGFKWISLGSMQRFVESAKDNRTNAFEIKITSKTTVTTEKTFQMSIGVGFKYQDFASVEANFGKQEYKFNTRTDELQLIVGAAGYKIFPVIPDRSWFSPEVFDKYRNWALKQQKNYFNVDGTMPLYPKSFIIVVGPRITMLVSRDDASKLEKMSTFGVKLNIGGFNFDFARNATMKKTTESNNLFKITVEGNSYEPQVLAVDNEILANGFLPKPRFD